MSTIDAHLERIAHAPTGRLGWDVVVVSTTSPRLAAYWTERLTATRGHVLGPEALVICVHEDWAGGAGNGLGTLYALRLAGQQCDLGALLEQGAAVALFHTAGRGTRLAPLPAAEANNKPAVKLPGLVKVGRTREPITQLEAVIRQSALYAEARRGRVSVFWGDQVFLPSVGTDAPPAHHADVLAALGPLPTAAEWAARGLHRYGLMAVGATGEATQLEKVDHATATGLLRDGRLDASGGIGVSLGSFSVSASLLAAMDDEFGPELDARRGKLDSDPHFWMPWCWAVDDYVRLMGAKGMPPEAATAHHARMRALADRVRRAEPTLGLLGAVDVGTDGYWWDYGQLRSYVASCRIALQTTPEGAAMRAFFGLPDPDEGGNVIVGGAIRAARLRQTIAVAVRALAVEADNAVLVDVRAPDVTARDCLMYHVVDHGPVALDGPRVRVDVETRDGATLTFEADLSSDGGAAWDTVLPGNPMSWDALSQAVEP